MFFKKLLDKMKNLVVIKYRTDQALDNIKVIINKNDCEKTDNVSNRKPVDWINFKEIYFNRTI